LFFKTQINKFVAARDYQPKMSVETVDMQMQPTLDEEVNPPMTLQRLTEVPPSPADAPEVMAPPGLAPPPGLSSPIGHSLPTEVKDVTPEMKELINSVSLELSKIADNFASSEFMTKDKGFELQYFSTMLPPGLEEDLGMHYMGDDENDSETRSITAKLDGNESSDESTKADSNPDESPKPDSNPDLDTSTTPSTLSDEGEDESNDEVPELPDLSPEGLSARKLANRQAKKITKTFGVNSQRSTMIVFGDQGAKLAAQAARRAARAQSGQYGRPGVAYAGVMAWQPPSDARAYSWDPYYGYVAW